MINIISLRNLFNTKLKYIVKFYYLLFKKLVHFLFLGSFGFDSPWIDSNIEGRYYFEQFNRIDSFLKFFLSNFPSSYINSESWKLIFPHLVLVSDWVI